jgi:hypothetical protein
VHILDPDRSAIGLAQALDDLLKRERSFAVDCLTGKSAFEILFQKSVGAWV